jgi:hypothetical protein
MAAVRPSVTQAAVQSWRDTAAVLRALTAQAWIAFAISTVLAYLQRLVGPGEKAFGTGPLLAGFIIACAQAFLLTPYLIAIHRFIILGEKAAGYELTPAAHRFQLFFLWSIALSMFYWVPAFLLGGFFTKGTALILLVTLVFLVVSVTALIVSVRLIILFPAIAVDAPGATWVNAMADTKGSAWRIILISMLSALPAFAGLIAAALLARAIGSLLSAIVDGAMNVLLITLAIAVASRLYEQLGNRVNRPD